MLTHRCNHKSAHWVPLTTCLLTACGSSSPADVPDGSPDAACECPKPPTLDEAAIEHVSWMLMLDSRNDFGQNIGCEGIGIDLGGSCTLPSTHPSMRLMYAGYRPHPEYPNAWTCGWQNLTPDTQEVITTVFCLPSMEPVNGPDGCDCPEYQPLIERITRVEQTAPFASYSTNELTAQCGDGALLLNGGCAFPSTSFGIRNMTLSRSGFATAEATTWQCGWNTPIDAEGDEMLATAYCLQPLSYGPDPLEGRITRVIETSTIPANGYASFTASCPLGDYLLSGSCMLDSADPASHQAIMYHHGFDATVPNLWRCGWNNPTPQAIPATAMATCVTPSQ